MTLTLVSMPVIGISLRKSYLKLPVGKALSFSFGNISFCLNLNLLHALQNELDAASGMKSSPLLTLLLGSQAQLGRVFFEDELSLQLRMRLLFSSALTSYQLKYLLLLQPFFTGWFMTLINWMKCLPIHLGLFGDSVLVSVKTQFMSTQSAPTNGEIMSLLFSIFQPSLLLLTS